MVWTTTFELRLPFVGPFVTRLVGRPLVSYIFGKLLDAADDALAAGP